MTTATKLWLGFGTLTALLVLSSVAIIVRVRSIEGQVSEMANARNLSAASGQLEINTLGYALDVRAFLQTGEPQARLDAVAEAAQVELHWKEYSRLARTDRQREMAARFAPLWQELKKFGQALLVAENRELKLEDSKKLYHLRVGVKKLLNDEIQIDAVQTYNIRRDAAQEDVQTILGFAWILLSLGLVVAVLTSGTVGRVVVNGERVIAEQGERLRTTLASIGDGVITTDTQGRITNLNGVAESLTGWTNAAALGQPLEAVFRILHEETHQLVENPALKALQQGVIVGLANHTVLVAQDGTVRAIDDSASPIRRQDGEIVGCVLVFRDVGDRKRADLALRDSERQFRTLADNIPQLAWIADAGTDGQVHWFNKNWFDYTGTTLEQMRGAGWHAVHHPDHAERVIQKFAHHVQEGLDWEDTFPLRGKDGQYRWFLSRMNVIRDESGTVVRIFGTNTDVTAAREMAEQLRQYAADLSESDRRKNEFLAMLAHELRNPLAPLRNAAQVLRLKGGNNEAVASASEMMERQVVQMVRLVDDLLDVSRISRGKIELRREKVELALVIQHAVEACRPALERANHHLTITLPPQPIHLNADPARLAQVVGNLLNNACKFTDKGGRIELAVSVEGQVTSPEHKAASALSTQHPPLATIRVRDSGIGIAADQLSRIFEMFVQIDTTLERSVSGLGIGLTLVKRLVEMHDGTVEVQSAGVGQGSEFVVRLPIMVEAPTRPPTEPPVSGPTLTPALRILVVDDNRDSATSLALLLQLTGHETHTAHDGLEAVEAVATFKPDVVLLDIGLPKLNGYEACRRIREQARGRHIVLVAVTGWGQEEDRQKSRDAGFNGHMVKPVDLAALIKLLTDLGPAQQ